MIKLIGKILVILLVIGLFTAGIYFLVQNGSSNSSGAFANRGFDGGQLFQNPNAAPGANGQQLQGRRSPEGFGDRDGGGFSLFRGLFGVLGHGLEIGIITFLVLFIRRLLLERKPAVQTIN